MILLLNFLISAIKQQDTTQVMDYGTIADETKIIMLATFILLILFLVVRTFRGKGSA